VIGLAAFFAGRAWLRKRQHGLLWCWIKIQNPFNLIMRRAFFSFWRSDFHSDSVSVVYKRPAALHRVFCNGSFRNIRIDRFPVVFESPSFSFVIKNGPVGMQTRRDSFRCGFAFIDQQRIRASLTRCNNFFYFLSTPAVARALGFSGLAPVKLSLAATSAKR
jgi:hypothetical protein